MSRSRRMPPLFEVMRETNPARTPIVPVPVVPPREPPRPASSTAGVAPVIRTVSPPGSAAALAPAPAGAGPQPPREAPVLTLRPSPAPASPPPVTPDAGDTAAPAAGPMRGKWDLNRKFVVPAKVGLIAAGGAIALLTVVWNVAWRVGAEAEKQKWLPTPDPTTVLAGGSVPADDPLARGTAPVVPLQPQATPNQGGSRPQGSTPQQPRSTQTQPAGAQQVPPQQQQQPAAAPAAGRVADPRGTGLNYLLVETVPNYADAEGIVAFLEANGLPAVAIPQGKAEIAAAKAANQKGWEVVLLEAIPGNQYSAKEARRRELTSQVQRLGERLGREGLSSFRLASPLWKRY